MRDWKAIRLAEKMFFAGVAASGRKPPPENAYLVLLALNELGGRASKDQLSTRVGEMIRERDVFDAQN